MRFEQVKTFIEENSKQEEKIMVERNVNNSVSEQEEEVVEVRSEEKVALEQEAASVETNVETEEAQSGALSAVPEGMVDDSEPELEIAEDVQAAGEGAVPDLEEVEIEASATMLAGTHLNVLNNSNLPKIDYNKATVTLCIRDNYALMMMPLYNSKGMVMDTCKLYLKNLTTNMVMIDAESNVRINKTKLRKSTEYHVLDVVKEFAVNFTEDDLKLAYKRAKNYIDNVRNMVDVSSSMTIQEAYEAVTKFAIEKAKLEDNAKNMEIEHKCMYDSSKKIVHIRDNYLQDILDEVGSGYTQKKFSRHLKILGECCGEEILISNMGRNGYNVGSYREYRIRVIERLFVNGGVA